MNVEMKKRLSLSGVLSLLCTTFWLVSVCAKIVEEKNIASVAKYVATNEEGLCVVFDLDNTTMHPIKDESSDEWFSGFVQYYVDRGMDRGEAIKKVLPQLFKEQFKAVVQPVEPEVVTIIKELQSKGICVIALTARSLELLDCTLKQLASIDIDFSKTALVAPQQLSFNELPYPAYYSHGVMFCSRNAKGKALLALFEKTKFHARKVFFIDDKLSYHECVQKQLREQGINDFLGIRYGFLDQKVNNFKYDFSKYLADDAENAESLWPFLWQPVVFIKTLFYRMIYAFAG